MRLIVKPIFLAPSGYWWAYSMIKPDRVHSMHTKDRAKAQADYDRQLAELQAYEAREKK